MYAKGITTRQISDTIEDTDVTDKLLPQIEEWQNRPLDEAYPVIYIDAINYLVRDNGIIRKMAAYVILGINCEGHKEVLSINRGENESAKYWLNVMNELKNRGVKDIMIICADGLSGIKEAISAAFPKYVPSKDMKSFAVDLKTIYNAISEEEGRKALNRVSEKWSPKYPHAMKRWYDNWDVVTPIFKLQKIKSSKKCISKR